MSIEVVIWDPWADKREVESQARVQVVDAITDKSCDAVIFAAGHREFRRLTAEECLGDVSKPWKRRGW